MAYIKNCSVQSHHSIAHKLAVRSETIKQTLYMYSSTAPRKTVQTYVENATSFIGETYVPFLQNQMQNELKDCSPDILRKVNAVLEKSKNPFSDVDTEYKRFSIYTKEALYEKPVEYIIGYKQSVCKKRSVVLKRTTPVKAVQVTLTNTLQSLFSLPGVLHETIDYVKYLSNNNCVLTNYIQGRCWKKNHPFNEDHIEFPIFLFYDDLETGNGLGTHAGNNKIGAIFASVACLPPRFISRLRYIFLSLLFYSMDRKKFGTKKILKPLIIELNKLKKDGIVVKLGTKETRIYFQLALVLGDNLGLNSIFGFVESFNALYSCRICTVKSTKSKKLVEEDSALLRSKENYAKAVMEKKPHKTGIKSECDFHEVDDFHVAENQSVDIMHDIFEGVANYILYDIIKVLIDEGFLTLETLNERIELFEYGPSEISNKPEPINADYFNARQKLKMSASEMACFSRYFGLMVGDLVPREHTAWKLYKILRRIIDIVTAPRVTISDIYMLKKLITDHHVLYIELFGALRPKFHNMVHYPRIMLNNGPLIHMWSMRFESKNRELKQTVSSTSCKKNVLLTIATKTQLLAASFNFSKLTAKEINFGPTDNQFDVVKHYFPKCNSFLNSAKTVKYVELEGAKLSTGTIILVDVTDDFPVFGQINKIYQKDDLVYFAIRTIYVNAFDEHYFAYDCTINNVPNLLINFNDLPSITPCLFATKHNLLHIATRFAV